MYLVFIPLKGLVSIAPRHFRSNFGKSQVFILIAKCHRYTRDFLQCALNEHFRPINTESDEAGPHVKMTWQEGTMAIATH
jgi:hypothetical protein